MLSLAGQTKNEPETKRPEYVLNLLYNERFMAIVNPGCECGELLARLGRKRCLSRPEG